VLLKSWRLTQCKAHIAYGCPGWEDTHRVVARIEPIHKNAYAGGCAQGSWAIFSENPPGSSDRYAPALQVCHQVVRHWPRYSHPAEVATPAGAAQLGWLWVAAHRYGTHIRSAANVPRVLLLTKHSLECTVPHKSVHAPVCECQELWFVPTFRYTLMCICSGAHGLCPDKDRARRPAAIHFASGIPRGAQISQWQHRLPGAVRQGCGAPATARPAAAEREGDALAAQQHGAARQGSAPPWTPLSPCHHQAAWLQGTAVVGARHGWEGTAGAGQGQGQGRGGGAVPSSKGRSAAGPHRRDVPVPGRPCIQPYSRAARSRGQRCLRAGVLGSAAETLWWMQGLSEWQWKAAAAHHTAAEQGRQPVAVCLPRARGAQCLPAAVQCAQERPAVEGGEQRAMQLRPCPIAGHGVLSDKHWRCRAVHRRAQAVRLCWAQGAAILFAGHKDQHQTSGLLPASRGEGVHQHWRLPPQGVCVVRGKDKVKRCRQEDEINFINLWWRILDDKLMVRYGLLQHLQAAGSYLALCKLYHTAHTVAHCMLHWQCSIAGWKWDQRQQATAGGATDIEEILIGID